jgi:hypothetical protein
MRIRRGTRARFNLIDGTTVEGTVQTGWAWWAWRITRPVVDTPAGPVDAHGVIYVVRRHVVFVQALHIEADGGEE